MALRVHLPGEVTTTVTGRVYFIRYPAVITLAAAKAAHEDYVEFTRQTGGEATPLLMVVEQPFPMPGLDVRTYWREVSKDEPGFEGIALVMSGVMGLMAAAATHLGEQLVAVLGVRFRTFTESYAATEWLCEAMDTQSDPDELVDTVGMLRSIDDRDDGDPAKT